MSRLDPVKSAAVKRWLRRLERVLMDAPEGVRLYTIGDADLTAYDAALAEALLPAGPADGAVVALGLDYGRAKSGCLIDSVSG